MNRDEHNFWLTVAALFLFGAIIGFMAGIAVSILI